jgi:DNA-binding response OmpR family regulator
VSLDGAPVELSEREFATLQELMANAGRVLTRAQLEDKLYGWGDEIGSNAVEVYVHQLRRKLYPEAIRTIRGVGYVMAGEEA